MNKRILSILVENTAGVLSRVSGLFSRRGYNIDSLSAGITTVSYTHLKGRCMKDDESWLEPCLDDYKSDCALSLNEKIPYLSLIHISKKETKLEKAQKLILELLTKRKVMCLEELEAELLAYGKMCIRDS